jgi:hypothetical protein
LRCVSPERTRFAPCRDFTEFVQRGIWRNEVCRTLERLSAIPGLSGIRHLVQM